MARDRGRLIALEGVDGCGKSTQAGMLADRIGALLTREPGGTATGRMVRSIVLDSEGSLDSRAEALLMVADRAQHCAEVIEPALAGGRWVVTDRFAASTFAYQGFGRGLELAELETISAWAARSLVPDLYVLIDVPLEVASARRSSQGDRMESEPSDFHDRVARGFAEQAASDPAGWAVIDGNAPVEEVAERVYRAVVEKTGLPARVR